MFGRVESLRSMGSLISGSLQLVLGWLDLGVDFKELVWRTQVDLKDLAGKSIAVDAHNALYQFLAIIRQPNGTPLRDSSGKVTSHLSGLLYRTTKLAEMGIGVAYVFDGAPPVLKKMEIEQRALAKRVAAVKYEKAVAAGKLKEARSYAQATSRVEDYMEEDSKQLLTLMGIPWVQAPSEGEAQAAYMTERGATDFCASQDYDSLLFGAPSLIRNVTLSGRRKLPRKPVYVNVYPEVVSLEETLSQLNVTHEQLVDIGILVGTDYNPGGVKGIGPRRALKLIQEHKSLIRLSESAIVDTEFPVDPDQIRELFLHPKVTASYALKWREPDLEGMMDFLCGEHGFAEGRVRKAVERIQRYTFEDKSRTTLDAFLP
jgi:flap endonuclease-1